jgi:hypothetical protein
LSRFRTSENLTFKSDFSTLFQREKLNLGGMIEKIKNTCEGLDTVGFVVDFAESQNLRKLNIQKKIPAPLRTYKISHKMAFILDLLNLRKSETGHLACLSPIG